jgi:hypothetical protein
MNASNILKALLAFAAGLAIMIFAYATLINPFWEASRSGATVMRSYVVHGDHADEVRVALQSALRTGDGKQFLGRVTLAPNGQLIVTAPESIQRGVSKLLDDVLSMSPGPTPTIKLEAWFVRGEAGEGASDPRLGEVQPALAAITETQGTTRFQLIEKLALHARAGHAAEVEGAMTRIHAEPTVRRAGPKAASVSTGIELNVKRVGVRFAADLELTPGELLVLGQSAYAEGDPATAPPQTLYYIVRATL